MNLKKDLLAKSLKETREANYWLKVLHHSDLTNIDVKAYMENSSELITILSANVKTTRSRLE